MWAKDAPPRVFSKVAIRQPACCRGADLPAAVPRVWSYGLTVSGLHQALAAFMSVRP